MTTVVKDEYWHHRWKGQQFSIASSDHPITLWLKKNVISKSGECFEIGCYPGRFLGVFGEMGYTLNGIDIVLGTDTELPKWLKGEGFSAGNFMRKDFESFSDKTQYDLVVSLGFIEHFQNWRELIIKQASLVKSGGILVLETPNFNRFLYRFFYTLLDKPCLDTHVLKAMDLDEWKKTIEGQGFIIKTVDYIGDFNFMLNTKHDKFRKCVTWIIMKSLAPIVNVIFSKSHRSRYIGIIAVRK